MRCPVGIGRESWGRVGQMSVGWLALISPQELGEEALAEDTRGGGNRADPFRVVVVESYCFYVCTLLLASPGCDPQKDFLV